VRQPAPATGVHPLLALPFPSRPWLRCPLRANNVRGHGSFSLRARPRGASAPCPPVTVCACSCVCPSVSMAPLPSASPSNNILARAFPLCVRAPSHSVPEHPTARAPAAGGRRGKGKGKSPPESGRCPCPGRVSRSVWVLVSSSSPLDGERGRRDGGGRVLMPRARCRAKGVAGPGVAYPAYEWPCGNSPGTAGRGADGSACDGSRRASFMFLVHSLAGVGGSARRWYLGFMLGGRIDRHRRKH
ncbi:hypothetical protein B0H13DRAFT_2535757, partial [Mycena leptocephala]